VVGEGNPRTKKNSATMNLDVARKEKEKQLNSLIPTGDEAK